MMQLYVLHRSYRALHATVKWGYRATPCPIRVQRSAITRYTIIRHTLLCDMLHYLLCSATRSPLSPCPVCQSASARAFAGPCATQCARAAQHFAMPVACKLLALRRRGNLLLRWRARKRVSAAAHARSKSLPGAQVSVSVCVCVRVCCSTIVDAVLWICSQLLGTCARRTFSIKLRCRQGSTSCHVALPKLLVVPP